MDCPLLKAFRRLDYRGLAAELLANPGYCALIELEEVPHFTTFQRAERRRRGVLLSRWQQDVFDFRTPSSGERSTAGQEIGGHQR